MKHSILGSLIVSLGVATLGVRAEEFPRPRQAHATEREIFLHGDFHGDGLEHPVVIDRQTGLYRSAKREEDGAPVWSEARATGIPAVDGAAVGRFRATDLDEFVATHPDANQLVFIQPLEKPFYAHPHRVPSPAPGPVRVAAGRFDETSTSDRQDLLLLSSYNSVQVGSPFELGFYSFVNFDNGEFEELSRMPLHITKPGALGPANYPKLPVDFGIVTADTTMLGRFAAYAWLEERFVTVAEYLGSAETRFEMATLFAAPEPSLLLWTRGTNALHHFVLTQSMDGATPLQLYPIDSCDLEADIEMVRVLEGGESGRILVVFEGAQEAVIYAIFDGCVEAEIDRFSAPDGEVVLGAVPDGQGGFTLLTGRKGGPSSGFLDFRRESADSYSLRAKGRLPDLDERRTYPNLVGFDADPFLFPHASPVDYYRYRDWTASAILENNTVTAAGETFMGETGGLGSVSSEAIGAALPAVKYLLPNQLHNDVSIAPMARIGSRGRDAVAVDPPPGSFDRTVRLHFSSTIPDGTIYYRIDGSQTWAPYDPATPVTLVTDSTIQFYARSDPEPGRMTAVSSATYSFSRSFNEFDSNQDGIPDFVRAHFGLDPFGQADTTGNGFTDLQEILFGSDPLDPNDFPTGRIDLGPVFDARLYALLRDPENPDAPQVGAAGETLLRAHDFNGARHAQGTVGSAPARADGIAGARLERLAPGDGRLFFTASTPSVFETASGTETWKGHEMVGLFPLPALEFPVIDYTPTGRSIEEEVARWIDAARQAFGGYERPILDWDLTPETTFATALFEHRLAELIAERDPAVSAPQPHTLLPHRVGDSSRQRINRAQLERLTRPDPATRELVHPLFDLPAAWSALRAAVEADDVRGENIRRLVRDVYRSRALYFNPGQTIAPLPLDAFRHFLAAEGDLPKFYAEKTELTSAEKAAALDGVKSVLLEAFAERRTESRVVEILNDTFDGNCRNVVDAATGQILQLVDHEGNPYGFPATLRLPAGSQLDLSGFAGANVHTGCPEAGFEVVAIYLVLLPTPVASDTNWNLLPDEWEKLHFGKTGIDPFADAGGNGYSNLQSYFEGVDPRMTGSIPGVAPVNLGAPQVKISALEDGRFKLDWNYPADYANRIYFYYEKSEDLSTWTSMEPDFNTQNGSGEFSAIVPGPDGAADDRTFFYRLVMGLR